MEKSISFGKNALFEMDIDDLIPDVLDATVNEKGGAFM